MVDVTYPLFPILAFLGFIVALIPLPWHLQAWNSGTCYFMIWSSLACLNMFVNSLVWAGNALDSAPAWCEISTRIVIGSSVGIPAASLCINRRLYHIAKVQAVMITRAEKGRAILIDSLICVLFPIICMVLAYIVQGHRYDIFEDLGCHPAIFNTLPAYFLVYMWPIVIGLVSAVYCSMSLRSLIRRQAQFNQFLSSGTSLTASRYFRLMALALTEMLLTVPFGIYEVYSNTVGTTVQPWRGWADAHFDFDRVNLYPALLWRAAPEVAVPLEMSRWIVPACSFIFFAYFGFAEEARRNYSKVFKVVLKRLALLRISPFRSNSSNSSASRPSQIPSGDILPSYSPPSASFSFSVENKLKADVPLYDIAAPLPTHAINVDLPPSPSSTHTDSDLHLSVMHAV